MKTIKRAGILILIGIIIAVVGFFWVRSWINSRPDIRFGKDRAAVIKEIQSLGRLETAKFTIDKVIEAGTEYSGIKEFLFGDKILLVANGSVIAGFDLTKMEASDFSGTRDSITIKLPPPEILHVALNNKETYVFDRKQGVLTKGQINLEAEARAHAESKIREAACSGNILREANQNAEKQLSLLFHGAGFKSVTVQTIISECTK